MLGSSLHRRGRRPSSCFAAYRHARGAARLRKLLRLHEEHYACLWADREASGVGPLIDVRNRTEHELEAAAKEACSLVGPSVGHVALRAVSLMAAKARLVHDCNRAPEPARAAVLLSSVMTGRSCASIEGSPHKHHCRNGLPFCAKSPLELGVLAAKAGEKTASLLLETEDRSDGFPCARRSVVAAQHEVVAFGPEAGARIAERAEMGPPSVERMARRLETRRHEGSDNQTQLA